MTLVWQSFAANVPRLRGTGRRVGVDGQRTNSLRNPRCEGAAVGVVLDASGAAGVGAWPTHWSLVDHTQISTPPIGATGLAWEVVSAAWPGGGGGRQFRVQGTASVTQGVTLTFEPRSSIVQSPPQWWAAAVEAQLVAGSAAGLSSLELALDRCSNNGQRQGSVETPLGAAATPARRALSTEFTTSPRVAAGLRLGLVSGNAVDLTLALRWPQLELGEFASTPILPPVASPQATTRGADLATALLSALGIAESGAGTYLWGGVVPQAAPAAVNQTILQINGADDNNRLALRNLAGGASIGLVRVAAGASASAPSLGNMTPGTPFAAGLVLNGAGRAAACIAGGAVQEVTGAPTAGLQQLRLGTTAAGLVAMFGDTGWFEASPAVLTDAALLAAVNAVIP